MHRLSKRAISIRECESLAEHQDRKAFIHLCFDDEDSSEDEIDDCILAELALLKASRYCLQGPFSQWDSNWERMMENGIYMSNDEFLSNFHMDRSCVMQLNSLVKNDEIFWKVSGKVGRRASMLHVMVLLKFLGSYGNAAAMQKIGHMMGILKGLVNDYVMQAFDAILKHREQVIKWPSIEEQRNISGRTRKVHGL